MDASSSLHLARADVVIRLDMNHSVGSGHAVRSMAIAQAVEQMGGSVLFVVSDDESKAELATVGVTSIQLLADCMHFTKADGEALGRTVRDAHAGAVLVDAYGVTDGFFDGLRVSMPEGCKVAWIDDLYTYELGMMERPVERSVDCVINYMLGAELSAYEAVYEGGATALCIAPLYAPVRGCFLADEARAFGSVRRIMVTSGSTNDDGILETMTRACLEVVPDAAIDVVIGALADFGTIADDRVQERRGMTDLSSLMHMSDLCVSAAGTTLYELSSIGVPTIAVPIVENQVPNAQGFAKAGLGLVVESGPGLEERLRDAIAVLAEDPAGRRSFVEAMHASIDCDGAKRIAERLYPSAGFSLQSTMAD